MNGDRAIHMAGPPLAVGAGPSATIARAADARVRTAGPPAAAPTP